MSIENKLLEILKQFRENEKSKKQLREWVTSNDEHVKKIIKKLGIILKIKNGDLKNISLLIAQLTNSLESFSIYKEGEFQNINDFEECEKKIKQALEKKLIKSHKEPKGFISKEIGFSEFYIANDNGSIWQLSIPERAYRGFWKQIG